MADPSRDLPRVINLAMCVAISSFILLNFSLFMVVGFQGLREKSTVAVVSLSNAFSRITEELIYICKGVRSLFDRAYRQSCLFYCGFPFVPRVPKRQRICKWTTHGCCERKSIYASNSWESTLPRSGNGPQDYIANGSSSPISYWIHTRMVCCKYRSSALG